MTSLVAGLSFFLSAIEALNSSSWVVMIFSIAELALASCKFMVSINNMGLGRLVIAPFNSDNALLAVIVFLSMVVLSISFFGGRIGIS